MPTRGEDHQYHRLPPLNIILLDEFQRAGTHMELLSPTITMSSSGCLLKDQSEVVLKEESLFSERCSWWFVYFFILDLCESIMGYGITKAVTSPSDRNIFSSIIILWDHHCIWGLSLTKKHCYAAHDGNISLNTQFHFWEFSLGIYLQKHTKLCAPSCTFSKRNCLQLYIILVMLKTWDW